MHVFVEEKLDRLPQCHLAVQGDDTLSMCHHIRRGLIVQAKDVGDHLCLIGLHDSLLMALVHHRHDVLFGDIFPGLLGIDAAKLQNQGDRLKYQPLRNGKNQHKGAHRKKSSLCRLLRIAFREALRQENAERGENHGRKPVDQDSRQSVRMRQTCKGSARRKRCHERQ